MKFDFHFHSTFSDGSETVDHLFQFADQSGICAVSLTDHDTVLGIPAEREASRKYKIPFIPAVEFTAKKDGIRFHVLGFRIDDRSEELIQYSHELLDCMNGRSKRQIQMMQKNGISIPEEEFFQKAGGGPLYRAKLLKVLADHGYVNENRIMALLPSYFGENAPYYEEDRFHYRSFEKICSMIRRTGGIPVLAHPGKIKKKNEALYYSLISSPFLGGLEVYHPENSEEVRAELIAIAKNKGRLYTGGTDYHGLFMKKPIPLGSQEIPDSVYDTMKKYLENG